MFEPQQVYTFKCPVCAKFFKYDEPGEPCCTGPGETHDSHELTVMHLVNIDNVNIHPSFAKRRIASPLLMPNMTSAIQNEIIQVKR